MSVTGNTIEVYLEDVRSRAPVTGMTCTLYVYGVSVSGNTVTGTKATPLTGSGTPSGITDADGFTTLSNVAPGVYAVVVSGRIYNPQIPDMYSRIEIGTLIRGAPDYLQMRDSTGGTWYTYVSTGGTLATTQVLT